MADRALAAELLVHLVRESEREELAASHPGPGDRQEHARDVLRARGSHRLAFGCAVVGIVASTFRARRADHRQLAPDPLVVAGETP